MDFLLALLADVGMGAAKAAAPKETAKSNVWNAPLEELIWSWIKKMWRGVWT